MSVPAQETLCAHGIEAIADTVVPAIRNRTDTGFCPMESAVWDISDPHEAKAALERKNFRDDGKEMRHIYLLSLRKETEEQETPMRKKLLVILLLLVVLIVLVVTRCGGKKDQQNDPADGQGFAQQSGKAELPAELKLGVVTETESGAMQLEVEQNGEKTVYVFSDITINDWYVPAVNYVVTNGLMSGTDVGGGLSLFSARTMA